MNCASPSCPVEHKSFAEAQSCNYGAYAGPAGKRLTFASYFPCATAAFGPKGEHPNFTGGMTYHYQQRFHPVGVGAVDDQGRIWLYCRDYGTHPWAPLTAWVHQNGETFTVEKS